MARWAYYQKLSGTLSLFKVDKRTGAPDWGSLRGTAAAEHAVRRRALAGLPYVFAVFCHSDKMFEHALGLIDDGWLLALVKGNHEPYCGSLPVGKRAMDWVRGLTDD